MYLAAISITYSLGLSLCIPTIASVDHLEEGVCIGCSSLQFNGKSRKQQNLDRGTGGILLCSVVSKLGNLFLDDHYDLTQKGPETPYL